MGVLRRKLYPYPGDYKDIKDVVDYLRRFQKALTEESHERLVDFSYYSESGHNHDGNYAALVHAHDSSYISIISTPTEGNFPIITAGGELQNSAYSNSSYAAASHNHDTVYPKILDTATSVSTISNTTDESTLYSIDLPAGELAANDALRVTIKARFLNQTGGARGFTLRIKLGSTTMYADVTKSFASSATYRPWFLEFILNNQNSQSAQVLNGTVEIGNTTAATTGLGDISGAAVLDGESPILGTATEDLSEARTLAITVQFPLASANLKIDRYFAMVEKLPSV